ncbi:MAG: PDZ domain-containing protein [Myxococcales bacterium]|nr:PDZ domain-containing protein [Myxococcales bacterium]
MSYQVALSAPARHELSVTMEVPALDQDTCVLAFPVWTPGSYMVRDFSRNVFELEVTDRQGKPLPVERLEKHRWQVKTGGRPFRVCHTVFAYDPSVRAAYLDTDRAVLNGTSLFFFVEGHVERPCTLSIDAPAGWTTSVALPRKGGKYLAVSYDELVDSPCAVGKHERYAFRVKGVPFEIAWMGGSNADMDRVVAGVKKIVQATGTLFGGFPFERYVFLVQTQPRRGGGLEHAASCTLNVDAMGFGSEAGYQSFFELVAHEFFHAWNVKRIRDVVLGPFDYGKENYTRLLWFHEGFTDYMETQLVLRAGLLSLDKFLDDTAKQWRSYVNKPGRNRTPLSELSFEAWIKQYKPSEVFTNRAISYYEKGRWVAFVLDLMMRERTRGRQGVPELFVWLWNNIAKAGRSLTASDILHAANEVGGADYTSVFARYVDGTDELPFPRLCAHAGLSVEARDAAREEKDALAQRRKRAWAGFTIRGGASGDAAIVQNVLPDSPAERSGLSFGDHVVAVAGHKVDATNVFERIADHDEGARVKLTFFRDEWLREVEVKLGRNPDQTFKLSIDPKAGATARAVLQGWLGLDAQAMEVARGKPARRS